MKKSINLELGKFSCNLAVTFDNLPSHNVLILFEPMTCPKKFDTVMSGWSIVYIFKAKSNFTLLSYIPFLGIGEWYFKCV